MIYSFMLVILVKCVCLLNIGILLCVYCVVIFCKVGGVFLHVKLELYYHRQRESLRPQSGDEQSGK